MDHVELSCGMLPRLLLSFLCKQTCWKFDFLVFTKKRQYRKARLLNPKSLPLNSLFFLKTKGQFMEPCMLCVPLSLVWNKSRRQEGSSSMHLPGLFRKQLQWARLWPPGCRQSENYMVLQPCSSIVNTSYKTSSFPLKQTDRCRGLIKTRVLVFFLSFQKDCFEVSSRELVWVLGSLVVRCRNCPAH